MMILCPFRAGLWSVVSQVPKCEEPGTSIARGRPGRGHPPAILGLTKKSIICFSVLKENQKERGATLLLETVT